MDEVRPIKRKRRQRGIVAFKKNYRPEEYNVKFNENNIPNGGMSTQFMSWFGMNVQQRFPIDEDPGKVKDKYFNDLWLEAKAKSAKAKGNSAKKKSQNRVGRGTRRDFWGPSTGGSQTVSNIIGPTKVMTTCHLLLKVADTELKVAYGMAWPTSETVIHSKPVNEGCVKVQVDEIIEIYENLLVHVVTRTDEVEFVKHLLHTIVQWPRYALKFEENHFPYHHQMDANEPFQGGLGGLVDMFWKKKMFVLPDKLKDMVLEMISHLIEMVIDSRKRTHCDDARRSLIKWVKKSSKEEIRDKIIDSDLRKQMELPSFDKFVKLALQCVEREPKRRPSMDFVVRTLESALKCQEKRRLSKIKRASGVLLGIVVATVLL
ncbi:unnamed protein product [Lactuca virosa]|uniref:DUF8039 domain-containing protein n=1 Tax=Lactuca virosa TaxID=75947 RepID=A0AAU9PSK1_9ASTR|nr:unnamed protein product [Lactuca virosa]